MPDERNPLDAQVGEVQSAAQKLVNALEAATRDVAASTEWATRNINVPHYSGTRAGGGVGEIEAETAAIERRNAADLQSLQIDEARARILAQQNAEMLGAQRGVIVGAAPYRPGGGQANIAREFEAQQAAARAEMESAARRAEITAGVPRSYSARGAGDTAAARTAEATRLANAELQRENQEVVRLIELYGEKAAAARQSLTAILDENAALAEQSALTRRQVTSWAAGGYPFAHGQPAHPAVVRSTLEDLAGGGFGPGTGEVPRQTLFPITHVRPGPSAATEFNAWANSLGANRNVAEATNNLQRLGQVQNEASQAMYRHGALTTEWLQALGRGEVTVADFGNQIALTAGKFAGWTAAAAGIFGIIGIFKQVTDGAKQAQDAAANLGRFIPNLNRDQAQSGLIGISQTTNIPMKEVGDASVLFARVTKGNLTDTLSATQTALLATKLDSVSTADSVRYFTAMMQELGLRGRDLPPIFDQISNAQRRLGARTQELLPALARSMGANRATGGDFNQLMAEEAAAIVLTGQSGSLIGTAFRQGASNYYRSAKSIQTERAIGGLPAAETTGFSEFVAAAVQRSRTLSGQQRLDLARAMFGTRGAGGLMAGFLGHPEILAQSTQVSAPGQGNALDELQHKLQGVHELLSSFPNTLQRIGAEITRTGAATGLGVALEVLKELLHSVEQLLHLFNQLPASIRPWLALLLEAGTAIAFTRETRIGGAIASATRLNRIPGVGRSAESLARDEFVSGATATAQMQANMREQTVNQAAIAEARRVAALQVAEQNRLLAEQETNETERDRLLQESNALERKAAEYKAESVQLERTAAAYDEQRLATLETANAVKRRQITAQEAGNIGTTTSAVAEDAALTGAAAGSARRFVVNRAGTAEEVVGGAAGAEALGVQTAGRLAPLFQRGFLAFLGEAGFAILGVQMAADLADALAQHFGVDLKHALPSPSTGHAGIGPVPQAGPSPGGHHGVFSNIEDLASLAGHGLGYASQSLYDAAAGLGLAPSPTSGDNGPGLGSAVGTVLGNVNNAMMASRRQRQQADPMSLYHYLQSYSEAQLQKQASSDAQRVADFAGTTGRGAVGTSSLNNLQVAYHVALDRAKTNPTSGNLHTLSEIQKDIETAIIQPTTQALSDALALTSDPTQRAAAYAQALSNLRQAPGRAGQVARQGVRTQQFQETQQNYNAYTSFLQSQTTDPLQQAQTQQQRDEELLPQMQDAYHRGLISYTDFWTFMAKINQDRQQTQQAILDDFTQQQQLSDAQFALSVGGDQGQILQRAVSDAQGTVAKIQSMGAGAPKGALNQANTSLLTAQLNLLQYNRQQAQQMWDANFQAAHVADQGDPVQAARNTLAQDIHDMRFQQGPGARAQQRGRIVQDRYNVQQSLIQEDINRADFEHNIGQLTDQQYIAQLQQILRMKQVSTQTRRQLLEQIYQVNQSAGQNLELNVGQIKLPTLYDVRRAAAAGAASGGASLGGGNVVVSHSPTMSFEINILHPSDASTVYKAIEDATGTSLQGSLRAAGAV